jgi:hypothetical protein
MSNEKPIPPDHLGDGVYVEDLGYAIAIRVNDHRNEPVVIMEPSVLEALIRYYERTKRCSP